MQTVQQTTDDGQAPEEGQPLHICTEVLGTVSEDEATVEIGGVAWERRVHIDDDGVVWVNYRSSSHDCYVERLGTSETGPWGITPYVTPTTALAPDEVASSIRVLQSAIELVRQLDRAEGLEVPC